MNVDIIIISISIVLIVAATAYTAYETGYKRGFNEAAEFCRKRIAEYKEQEAKA